MNEAKKIVILPLKLILNKNESISEKYSEYAITIGLNLFKMDGNLFALIGNDKNDGMQYLIDMPEISKKYPQIPFCVNINCKNLDEFMSVEDKFKLLTQNRFLFVSSEDKKILKYLKNSYESIIVFMTAFDLTKFYFFAEIGLNFLLKKIEGDAVLIPERSGLVKLSGNTFLSKLRQFNKSIFIYTNKDIENLNYNDISGYYLINF